MEKLALEIAKKVKEAGGTALYSGGWVRDMLLGVASNDIDIEVFNLSQDKIEKVLSEFGEVNFVGKQYGCYKIKGIDVTLPRKDEQVGEGHRDVEAVIDTLLSVAEAANRRDLTINAIYYNPLNEKVIDPIWGKEDLYQGTIRPVSFKSFKEDPLRPIRAARFKALYPHMNVVLDIIYMFRSQVMKDKVATLPPERIFGEVVKVLLKAPMPSIFFKTLEYMELLEVVFPELHRMKSVEQGKAYHPEGSVFNHIMMAIDAVPVADRELDVMLALLFHDLGKALVPNEVDGDKIHFKGHAEELMLAKAALSRLTNEKDLTDSVMNLISHHMRPYDFIRNPITKKAIRRLAVNVDMEKLGKVHAADRLGRGRAAVERYEKDNIARWHEVMSVYYEVKNQIAPFLLGRDLIEVLGMKPGPHFGTILKEVYEKQLDGYLIDRESALSYVRLLHKD